MTIDEAYVFCNTITNKGVQTGNLSPQQFNNLAPIAQLSVINELIGNEQEYQVMSSSRAGGPAHPVSRYGLGINQKNLEELRPIITIPTALVLSGGVGIYPTDSLYLFDLAETSSGKEIYPCEVDEARILAQSVIKPPIVGRASYYVLGPSIYVLPASITNSLITYVKKPADPLWNYVFTTGVPTYVASGGLIGSGNSQDFLLSPLVHLRICSKILQAIGINLSMEQVVAYSAAVEAQGA